MPYKRITDKKCIKCGSDVYVTSYGFVPSPVIYECNNCHWGWSFIGFDEVGEENNPEIGSYNVKTQWAAKLLSLLGIKS